MTAAELRKIRCACDATLADVAAALGVAVATVCNWENGWNPVPDDLDLKRFRQEIETLAVARKARMTRRREELAQRRDQRRARNQLDGEAFRRMRLALGVSQHAIARVLGVHQRTVHDWERGRLSLPAGVDLFRLREVLQADTAAARERVKRASAAGRKRWRDQLKPEQRAAYLRLLSVRSRQVWLRRGKPEVARMIAPLVEAACRWREGLTEEQRAQFMRQLQEGAQRWWASLTPAERSERQGEQFWRWFPELDLESRRRVLTAISHRNRSEQQSKANGGKARLPGASSGRGGASSEGATPPTVSRR
jgi:DNA-binding transcriptional regulator YiaG